MKFKDKLKWLFQVDRLFFNFINLAYSLNLNFQSNKNQLSIFKEVFYHKVYELGFPKGIENGVIVDIGAHYGFFSIFAAKNLKLSSKIFAIEPSPDNFTYFIKNIQSTGIKNIIPSQIAISCTSKDRHFYTAKSWNHSLFENYLDHMVPSSKVKCLSLEDFMNINKIAHIDFLKIDCEGAEHEILQNCDLNTLMKINTISMEIHDMSHCGFSNDATVEVLRNAGFDILFSDYESKRHKKGFNAKVVLKRKNID